jgi:hypothetical protein
MPNGQSRTQLLKNLVCRTGLTYYWSVATVDTGFRSTSSAEQTFTLDNNCTVSFSGGGGSSSPDDGGGLSADYFRTNETEDLGSSPGNALLTVSAFKDLDGNGIKNGKEMNGFKGLSFTASGRTLEDIAVSDSVSLSSTGEAIFDLPPSDDRGYFIIADTGSIVLDGYEATGKTSSGGYVLDVGDKKSVSFGFKKSNLLAYKPCLSFGTPSDTEIPGSDANILLQRLQDSFGVNIMKGSFKDALITRKEFFSLLLKSHCVPLLGDTAKLQTQVSIAAKTLHLTLPLIDLPLSEDPLSLLTYSLLAAGADIGRGTLRGDAADLSSPITRSEAIRAIASILHVPVAKRITTGGILPNDLPVDDPLVSDFLTLQSLHILPESFLPILGPSQGIDKDETALLLTRAGFRGGRISLVLDTPSTKKKGTSTPTFLSLLPTLKARSCFEKDLDRSSSISFTDILPGDRLFDPLRDLLSRGTKNSSKKTLWLLSGTRRPTEFGITKGQTSAELSAPVSLLETIRNLLVLSCLPPPTAIDVLSGKDAKETRAGSAANRVPRDRISGLPRDASFPSRILYRAQDHQKEFDLSLFTFAPNFLHQEIRSPATGLSVAQASDILASGLLMIYVKEEVLTPLDAENLFQQLSSAITKDFLGKDINWRQESITRATPFTREMLLTFLSTVTSNTTSISSLPPPSTIPLGEAWWERVQ